MKAEIRCEQCDVTLSVVEKPVITKEDIDLHEAGTRCDQGHTPKAVMVETT